MDPDQRRELSETFHALKAWGLSKSIKINTAILAVGRDLLGLLVTPNDIGLRHKAMVDIECLRLIARNEL